MKPYKTLTLIGGIGQSSLNKTFFKAIRKLAPQGFDFGVFDISLLPYFSQDLENDPPDIVTEFKEEIRTSDCVLVITPEYNRSYPGVLKNALDWGSRPYGQNLWDEKPAAILGASVGSIGTFGAQNHLRQIFSYLNVKTFGQPEIYLNASQALSTDGSFKEKATLELIHSFFSTFRELIETSGRARPETPQTLTPGRSQDAPATH
jgi:NAD(P)H-dependent FMN reductase